MKMRTRDRTLLLGMVASLGWMVLGTVGCDSGRSLPAPVIDYSGSDPPSGYGSYGSYGAIDPETIQFNDEVETNAEPDITTFDLEFLDRFGKEIKLKDFYQKKNILLVITRGYNGAFCPYCNAQTSRLIRNHEKFAQRDTEVIVVYPGESAKAEEFVDLVSKRIGKPNEELPFSIVLDEDLSAVNKLMIAGDLAKPSTYILDRDQKLRFAYVGRTSSDRPSLKAILEKLDSINGG